MRLDASRLITNLNQPTLNFVRGSQLPTEVIDTGATCHHPTQTITLCSRS